MNESLATLREAEEWKAELVEQLKAKIRIREVFLRCLREELAELRKLYREELLYYYMAQPPAQVDEIMRPKREREQFLAQLEDIWIAGVICKPLGSGRGPRFEVD